MRLSAKILKNVNSVNSWQYVSQSFMQEGQANIMYLQLVDLDQSTSISPEKSPANPEYPIRYISSAASITLTALFDSIDSEKKITITATQPFSQDLSIFKLNLSSSQVPNSGNLLVTLVEDGVSRSFVIRSAVNITTLNVGSC
jgi:hypothetical protein